VQNVAEFPKAVDWLYAGKDIDLYLTGSNAFLLSPDIATLLSGRFVEIKMISLSFKEYASAFPTNTNKAEFFSRYLEEGSFPGLLQFEREKDRKAYLEGLTNTILGKDIITRKRIADPACCGASSTTCSRTSEAAALRRKSPMR